MFDVYDALSPLDDAGWRDPDGYTAAEIDALIAAALPEGELDSLSGPYQDRRTTNRSLDAAVRTLRAYVAQMPDSAGNEAA
ncbi:hypothetical protein [Kutzneria sp. NPDC051319]|uniref:hypothetical protein n=1 Tax=Kutzneria sp. NPDC051319 TaxID=3155047 RepID=UPI00343A6EBE